MPLWARVRHDGRECFGTIDGDTLRVHAGDMFADRQETGEAIPLGAATLPRELVVFDAIVKPKRTPLLTLAENCGCTTVYGREMMRGQISRMVDFFLSAT